MTRRFALLGLALLLTTAACTKEKPQVTSNGSKQDTLNQVRDLQTQVRQYGDQFIAAVGGGSPVPGIVRIGPVPCSGKISDLAEDGSYYVSGGWQIPLAAGKQVPTIRAIRDDWQAKGYTIVTFMEIDDNTRIRLEGEDPGNGFTFSVISTNPPTAVSIRVLSTCVRPPDGQYPGDSATIYE